MERQIANDELSDRDGFYYLLAHVVVWNIASVTDSGIISDWLKALMFVLLGLIAVWGLHKAYKMNSAFDGKDFLKRALAICWVVGMRVFVALVILGFIVGMGAGIVAVMSSGEFMEKNSLHREWFVVIVGIITQLVSYLLVVNSFRRIKSGVVED